MVVDFQGKHNQKSCWPKYTNTYIQTVPYTIFICTMYIIVQTFDFVKTHNKPNRFIYLYQVNILVENPKSSVMMPSNVVNYPRYTIPSGNTVKDPMTGWKVPQTFKSEKYIFIFIHFIPLSSFPRGCFFFLICFFLKQESQAKEIHRITTLFWRLCISFFVWECCFGWMINLPTPKT